MLVVSYREGTDPDRQVKSKRAHIVKTRQHERGVSQGALASGKTSDVTARHPATLRCRPCTVQCRARSEELLPLLKHLGYRYFLTSLLKHLMAQRSALISNLQHKAFLVRKRRVHLQSVTAGQKSSSQCGWDLQPCTSQSKARAATPSKAQTRCVYMLL